MKCKCDSCGKKQECEQQVNFGILRWLCKRCKVAANEAEFLMSGKGRADVAKDTWSFIHR